jgi:hypothetical protein
MSSQTATVSSIATTAATTNAGSARASQARRLGAATLVGIGAGSLALRALDVTPAGAAVIVLAVGLALLVAHLVTRMYGLLVPGGILTGLGAGLVASQQLATATTSGSGLMVLGLGLGFLSIWVIGGLLRVDRHHWWPLIPGGILALIGGSVLADVQGIQVTEAWPVILVAVGLLVLWRTRAAARAAA